MAVNSIAPMMNKVALILGDRGTGKTAYLKGERKLNIIGLINRYVQKGMKVLIVDTIDHASYRDIEFIEPSKFDDWDKGVYRIFVPVQMMPRLNDIISRKMWNTLVVYEDAHKHQNKYLDKSIMRFIGDSKQKNCDIIFMYHCFALVPIDVYRYVNYIELFKTKDSPLFRKQYMLGYWDAINKAYNSVMKNKNRFAHITVDTDI